MLLHQLHDERDLRHGENNQFAADELGQGDVHGQAVRVEEGEGGEHALWLIPQARDPCLALEQVGYEVAVRKHRALGRTGRTGGVHHQRDGVLINVLRRLNIAAVATDGIANQRLPRHGIRRWGRKLLALGLERGKRQAKRGALQGGHGVDHVDGHDRFQVGGSPQLLQGGRGLVPGDGDARAVILEKSLQLVGGIERIVQHNLGTELQDGIKGRDVLRAIGGNDGYAVTGAHAEGLKACCGGAHLAVQLGIVLGASKEIRG